MTSDERPGFVHRRLNVLGLALKRFVLGKSSREHMSRFTGSDEYWDRAIAAQLGWPQNLRPKIGRFKGQGKLSWRSIALWAGIAYRRSLSGFRNTAP